MPVDQMLLVPCRSQPPTSPINYVQLHQDAYEHTLLPPHTRRIRCFDRLLPPPFSDPQSTSARCTRRDSPIRASAYIYQSHRCNLLVSKPAYDSLNKGGRRAGAVSSRSSDASRSKSQAGRKNGNLGGHGRSLGSRCVPQHRHSCSNLGSYSSSVTNGKDARLASVIMPRYVWSLKSWDQAPRAALPFSPTPMRFFFLFLRAISQHLDSLHDLVSNEVEA